MKNIMFIKTVSTFVLVLIAFGGLFSKSEVCNAQNSQQDYDQKHERDKNVSKEKVEKAFEEARKITESILAIVADKKSEFKLKGKASSHLISNNTGDKGATRDGITWETKKTRLFVTIRLGITKEEELISFHFGLTGISIGDFYKIENIGDEAILVKNVTVNKKNTSVGIHFVKGRAQVDIYLTNFRRSTEKNEKELMEFARLIEPLIIARPNFDDGF